MGAFLSQNDVDNTIKKNQEYIQEMNRIKMERWIHMNHQIKQREKAIEIARNRELFLWFGAFYLITAGGLLSKFSRVKRPAVLTPLVPLTFVTFYLGDLGYGSKVHRIQAEAEMIMNNESELLKWPCDVPTVAEIDYAREMEHEDTKLHPPTPDIN